MTHQAVLPMPELRGEGTVTYRCATCGETTDAPVWGSLVYLSVTGATTATATNTPGPIRYFTSTQPAVLTPDTRTYHPQCIGDSNGR